MVVRTSERSLGLGMPNRQVWLRVFAVVLTAIGLVSPRESASADSKGEVAVVRWGTTPSIELQTPLYVALARGFFADEGIKIENDNVMIGSGPRVRESLMTNDIDFGEVGASTYIVGRVKGVQQRLVANYYTKEIFSLYVRSELRDRVKTMKDLKGHKIGLYAMGSSSYLAALSYVERAGLKPDDVSFVPLNSGDPAIWLAAFERSLIDVGAITEPIPSALKARNSAFVLLDITDPSVHQHWVGDEASSCNLAVNEELIKNKPEVVQRAVNAIKKALAYIDSQSPEQVAAITASRFRMKEEILAGILTRIKGNFSKTGALSRSGLANQVDLARRGGILNRDMRYEEMVDTRFAGSAK